MRSHTVRDDGKHDALVRTDNRPSVLCVYEGRTEKVLRYECVVLEPHQAKPACSASSVCVALPSFMYPSSRLAMPYFS